MVRRLVRSMDHPLAGGEASRPRCIVGAMRRARLTHGAIAAVGPVRVRRDRAHADHGGGGA